MTNQYVPDLSPLGAGDIARSSDVNTRYENTVAGFDRLPAPKTGEAGFEGPVPVGEPVNSDHATTKNWVETSMTSQVNLASGYATASSGSAAAALSSQNAAASSASSASTSASTANTKASEASSSASSASASASSASSSASSASTSASTATTQAGIATTQASSASSSASSALAAKNAAEAAYDSFDDRYLGAKASDPTVDNDGNALIIGAMYFDTNVNRMKVFDGSLWNLSYVPAASLTLQGVTDNGSTTTNSISVNGLTASNASVNFTGIATTTSTTDPFVTLTAAGRVEKRTLGALAFSSATYDNYQGWNLNGGTTTEAISKNETVTFVGAGSASVSNSGNTVTITATDTNTTNFNVQANSGTAQNIAAGNTINFTGSGGVTVSRTGTSFTINGAAGGITELVQDTTPQLGGTLDANGQIIDMGVNNITDSKVGEWDAAYGDKVNTIGFDTATGILTLNRQDGGTVTKDLDGRYVENDGTGATGTWSISISGNAATATTASAAPFSGITGKPTTLSGYGITDAVWKQGTDIPGSADLNTYITAGFYHQNTVANASSGTNYPEAEAGMLEVTADGLMVYQRYTLYNSGIIYTRAYYNGTWYPWRELADTSTIASTYSPLSSPTFTGTVTLPASTSVGNVSSTELGYLDGVTSAIQTQIDGKQSADADLTTLAQPGSLSQLDSSTLAATDGFLVYDASAAQYKQVYSRNIGPTVEAAATQTLALADGGKFFYNSSATTYTYTVPPNSSVAFPVGTEFGFGTSSTGRFTLAQGSGVTINSLGGNKSVKASGGGAYLIKVGTDAWFLAGDLEA